MLAGNTKVPEAAMKFLELTYTDKEIANLIIWGIEGRDYVMTEDGHAAYPDGPDASKDSYESLDWELEQNQNADVSPAMGFSFDSSKYTTQYTAVRNVLSQYLPGIFCGSVDPNTEIPKMIDALNAAGYQDILSGKQEQLNEWLKSK